MQSAKLADAEFVHAVEFLIYSTAQVCYSLVFSFIFKNQLHKAAGSIIALKFNKSKLGSFSRKHIAGLLCIVVELPLKSH